MKNIIFVSVIFLLLSAGCSSTEKQTEKNKNASENAACDNSAAIEKTVCCEKNKTECNS